MYRPKFHEWILFILCGVGLTTSAFVVMSIAVGIQQGVPATEVAARVLPSQPAVNINIELTIAEKNNNPLNVKGEGWRGQYGTDEFGHARFTTPAHGVRAAANVLMSYSEKHGIDTVQGIVNRFCEANKAEYAAFVSKRLGVKPGEKIDVIGRLPDLLEAMSHFETGKDWNPELFVPYSLIKTAFVKAEARKKL